MYTEIRSIGSKARQARLGRLEDALLLLQALFPEIGPHLARLDSVMSNLDIPSRETLFFDHKVLKLVRRLGQIALNGVDCDDGERLASLASEASHVLRVLTQRCEEEVNANGIELSSDSAVAWSNLPPNEKYHIELITGNTAYYQDILGTEYAVVVDKSPDLYRWNQGIHNALGIIEKDPLSAELVSHFVGYVLPLKKRPGDIHNYSLSVRGLPGVVCKTDEMDDLLFAETLVHEADHQFFYAFESTTTAWSESSMETDCRYYSPWRDDPRPMDGVLRGASAFVRVAHLYSKVAAITSSQRISGVLRQLALRLEQTRVALKSLGDHSDSLTDDGHHYLREMREIHSRVQEESVNYHQMELYSQEAKATLRLHRLKWEELQD